MFILASEPSLPLVVGLGLGMVFFGLICIIALCYILGAIIRAFESRKPAPAAAQPTEQVASAQTESIAKNGALIAAISAAIAEDMGTDVSAIRIKSIKKL
jgi:sodium pump decarboxylase gamma subunit